MSLSQKNLASIQKAGQAAQGASEAIAAAVRTQAASMVLSVASQPFGAESEQAIARFKVLARLSQGLAAVEKELQSLYAIATDLANPASDVISLPSVPKHEATNAAAVDVVAKPVKNTAKKKSSRKPAVLTENDNKLLRFLNRVLKNRDAVVIAGSKMAEGSGLPLGSVGVSLKKIIASGAVDQVGRGTYKLGAAVVPGAEAPTKEVPVKKATREKPAKKVKASGKAVTNPEPTVDATVSADAGIEAAPL
jgi:hypothetical protein